MTCHIIKHQITIIIYDVPQEGWIDLHITIDEKQNITF
jgi:hypothetical protein